MAFLLSLRIIWVFVISNVCGVSKQITSSCFQTSLNNVFGVRVTYWKYGGTYWQLADESDNQEGCIYMYISDGKLKKKRLFKDLPFYTLHYKWILEASRLIILHLLFHFASVLENIGGTTVTQWLRCCVTNRMVTGSIPDGVNGIFHWHNLSDRTMALGSTQPLTEMSTRSISWGQKRSVRKTDNLTTILCRCHVIWEP